MSLKVSEIVMAVRDADPRFSDRAVQPEALRRHLSDFQRSLFAEALAKNRRFQAQTQTIALPLDDFAAGEPLDAYETLLGGSYINGAVELPLYRGSYEDRFTPRRFPAAYEHGGNLHLVGSSADWQTGSVKVDTTPLVVDLATLESEFALPDYAKGVLVAAAAAFAARKVITNVEQLGPWLGAVRDEKARFLDLVSQ